MFCGIFVQAIPFLGLGVVISGLVAAFVSADRLTRWLPRRPAAAILTAGVGGAALPGCECDSVPVASVAWCRRAPNPKWLSEVDRKGHAVPPDYARAAYAFRTLFTCDLPRTFLVVGAK